MLDINRLSSNVLLIKSGWSPEYRVDIEKAYNGIEKGVRAKEYKEYLRPQVSIDKIFPCARDVIETLNGIRIENLHPELGLGNDSYAIEFDFFEYDLSNAFKLESLYTQYAKRFLYIGIGYDIVGDWLIDEIGAIYFQDNIRNRMHLVSQNIYEFLECDIYKLTDVNGESIFAD